MTDRVYAFEPQQGELFYVAETLADLRERAGEYVGAEQCDNCGGGLYRIEAELVGKRDAGGYVARCVRDDLGRGGCGAEYPIGLRDSEEVIFP